MDTTEYLLSNPNNREHLLASIAQTREGKNLIHKTVAELEAMSSQVPPSSSPTGSTSKEQPE
ncbi:hypothetical protein DAETH_08760 [Deinococcus aetherius]|uniref:Uncharacterized protein n=1 Tax=Deinococcus aetherius TaxID=200252 RepID=A0ABM8AAW6_9DEIO|nr:hypothetical protein DAETH_08760 [Deinococcus aetherius]